MSGSITKQRSKSKLDPILKNILEQTPNVERGKLLCAQCGFLITSEDQRIQVLGQHQHFFTNPYGYQFQVACFRLALGCGTTGKPTHADTWFPGYFWRLASCSECSSHLGWSFENNNDHFFGLIVPRLQTQP